MVIEGTEGADSLSGDAEPNEIFGYGGNDTVFTSGGADTIDGGEGRDFLQYFGGPAIQIDLRRGFALDSLGVRDIVENFESAQSTSGDDYIRGNAADNVLVASTGADTLIGGGGADFLDTGDGADWCSAGDGADTIRAGFADTILGGDGNDVISFGSWSSTSVQGGSGFDELQMLNLNYGLMLDLRLAGPQNLGAYGRMTVRGIESVVGTIRDDEISGDAEANKIWGFGGDDLLFGRAGEDTFLGSSGLDTLDGGRGRDIVWYSGLSVGVRIDLGIDGPQTGVVSDTLVSIENLSGSIHDDELIGDEHANLIKGQSGADTLRGGGGRDTLDGGPGADVLVFDAAQRATVEVIGFTSGEDRVDLASLGLSNFTERVQLESDCAGGSIVAIDIDGDGAFDDLQLAFVTATPVEADFLI